MKGEILFEKMTNISDEYINEAAMGEAYGNPRRDREDSALSRLLNSGWFVATVCAVISLCVVVALVRWGQAGNPTEPPVGPAGSTPPVSSSRFEFSYELFDAQGNPLTTPVTPGDFIAVKATVINRGLPFLYSGSSWEFCPDVRLIHEGEDKTTVLHGEFAHIEDFGTFLVKTGEVGQVSCEVYFPDDAPEGVYDLVLSYKDVEQVFTGALTVEAHEVETDIIQFSFGYQPNVSNTTLPLDFLCLDVWVKNEGAAFTFEGSSSGFVPQSTLRHQKSGYTITGEFNLTDDYGTVTVQSGEVGTCSPVFHITPDIPMGVYDLVVSYTLDGQTFEQVFTDVYALAGDEPSPSDEFPTLDPTTEALLCNACAAANPYANSADISVRRYYGTFDTGAIVAMINDGSDFTTADWSEQVGPADIRYYDGRRILVLYDRIFLTLQEAFDQGALTAENLATIENVHRQYVPSLYSDPD